MGGFREERLLFAVIDSTTTLSSLQKRLSRLTNAKPIPLKETHTLLTIDTGNRCCDASKIIRIVQNDLCDSTFNGAIGGGGDSALNDTTRNDADDLNADDLNADGLNAKDCGSFVVKWYLASDYNVNDALTTPVRFIEFECHSNDFENNVIGNNDGVDGNGTGSMDISNSGSYDNVVSVLTSLGLCKKQKLIRNGFRYVEFDDPHLKVEMFSIDDPTQMLVVVSAIDESSIQGFSSLLDDIISLRPSSAMFFA